MSTPDGWRLAPPVPAWLAVGVGALLLGVLARRPDVAVLGVPLLLGAALGWSRWPGRTPRARLAGTDQAVGDGRLRAELEMSGGGPRDLVSVRVAAPGHRPQDCLLAAHPRTVALEMASVRTGRRRLFRLDAVAADPSALLVTPVHSPEAVVMTVLPTTRPLAALPLPFRLQGLTGPHGSRRAGDGGELHDVAPFRPGDRLRRVDWRVTARLDRSGPGGGGAPTQLYVRRTFATADATVMLVVDSRDDVGPRVASWGDAEEVDEDEATSLDLARHAAASLARAYLEAGDRVGLEDLGRLRRPSPPAGGRSQLARLVQQLAQSEPEGEPRRRRRVPRLPSGSLVVLFSTFLDDDAADIAGSWRQSGHRVVAVDILPVLVTADLPDRQRTAYRVVAMERADRLDALARLGVETVSWRLAAGLDPAGQLGVLARQRHRR